MQLRRRAKNPTTIGKRVFIGSDTALVAPVRMGDGAYVAAGSTITENVPADALAIAAAGRPTSPDGRESGEEVNAKRNRASVQNAAPQVDPRSPAQGLYIAECGSRDARVSAVITSAPLRIPPNPGSTVC